MAEVGHSLVKDQVGQRRGAEVNDQWPRWAMQGWQGRYLYGRNCYHENPTPPPRRLRFLEQIIRRLLHFGIPGLEHPQVEPLFEGFLQRMRSITAALEQHQAAARLAGVGAGAGAGDGPGGVLEELQELLERMASTAVDAQKGHPIGFRR